jgi:hypothetical protein
MPLSLDRSYRLAPHTTGSGHAATFILDQYAAFARIFQNWVVRRIAMIPKTFIMAKEIRAMRVKSLRGKKSLRDHRAVTPSAK